MKQKNWSTEIFSKVESALHNELFNSKHAPIAAIDADGTLWNTDLGEAFFKFQIENKLLPNLPAQPWEHYRKMKESGDPRPAYLWLAQINSGVPLAKVREWAEAFLKKMSPLPFFPEMKQLVETLRSKNVDIYIVTASVKWAIEPAALELGLPYDNVLGVETKVRGGVISEDQAGILTYKEGKPAALLDWTSGKKPFLAAGNTTGDLALLESATTIRLAVSSAPEGHELFKTENELASEANKRGWLTYQF